MSESPGFQANLQRGELLHQQGRYPESEKYLQQAISEEPSNPDGYYELAFCYCNWSGHSQQALEMIDHAISLDPERAAFFSLRAWILGNLKKNKEALEVGDQALAMNPFSIMALNARTRAYNNLEDWNQMEASARRTLAIEATNEFATNLLAVALRNQGRNQESEAVTMSLLSQVPDNAMAQCNAGWSALQKGDHRRANQHFMEALRLEPNYDSARHGLLHSFNSRVWIYRVYYQFIAWLGKHRKEMRYFFIFLVYAVYRLIVTELRTQFGREGFHWSMVIVALYIVLFGFGRSFANLFLLLDPFARYALTRKEMGWSLLAGTIYGLFLGLLIAQKAWPQTAFLVAILAFFLWGVLEGRFRDVFAKRFSSSEG